MGAVVEQEGDPDTDSWIGERMHLMVLLKLD
jgi:hypothetical protein